MSALPITDPTITDLDPEETREWLDALEAVIEKVGPERAHFLIEQLIQMGHRTGINIAYSATTEYVNTIPVNQQVKAPGDYEIEHTIRSYVRWNALAMVLRANRDDSGLGRTNCDRRCPRLRGVPRHEGVPRRHGSTVQEQLELRARPMEKPMENHRQVGFDVVDEVVEVIGREAGCDHAVHLLP